jgi:hypothetical protein
MVPFGSLWHNSQVILYAFCVQPPGEQWTAFSLMLFSTVALLLLHLVKRSLRSPDLNMALQQLDCWLMDSAIFTVFQPVILHL